MRLAFWLFLALTACKGADEVDADGDGHPAGEDCDDADPLIHPSNTEACDGIDQDCDGAIDENVTFSVFADADGDGFGVDPATPACEVGAGESRANGDCDDADAGIHPEAAELCDGIDQDCDDAVDEDVQGIVWYVDGDGDGYGDATIEACTQPSGTVDVGGDCDDADASVNPDAAEACDPQDVDEDCDGLVDGDDPDATGTTAYYPDADGDGYGDETATAALQCEAGSLVTSHTDCDDGDDTVHPSAAESCTDSIDKNCDGAAGAGDGDGDGYAACEECDDSNAAIHPGAVEVCDPADADEDCNGDADDADVGVTGTTTFYRDRDGDGFGGAAIQACDRPAGSATVNGDCDEGDASINPAAAEVCDALDVDEDCDGLSDDDDAGAQGRTSFHADADGDGYGDGSVDIPACDPDPAAGRVADGTDCNDADASTYPQATEVCDGADNDCDGLLDQDDPDATGGGTWYPDADGDGYGDPASAPVTDCIAPAGMVGSNDDCDEGDPAVNPGAPEVCDRGNTDEDCDGAPDDFDASVLGTTAWYADADGDGQGAAATVYQACDPLAGGVSDARDCDDADSRRYAGAPELCDGWLDDCGNANWTSDDGTVTFFGSTLGAVDEAANFGSGTSTNPYVWTAPESGTLAACGRVTWYARIIASNVDLAINAPAGTFDAGSTDSVIIASGGSLQLTGVHLTHGIGTQIGAGRYGGGVYAAGTAVTLDAVSIDGNSASSGGGMHLKAGASLEAHGSLFINDQATSSGGGLDVEAPHGPIIIEGTLFSSDYAGAGNGGGISIVGGSMTIGYDPNYGQSTIQYCGAGQGGGLWTSGTNISFFGSILYDDAIYNGGGVAVTNGALFTLEPGSVISGGTGDSSAAWLYFASMDIVDSQVWSNSGTFATIRVSSSTLTCTVGSPSEVDGVFSNSSPLAAVYLEGSSTLDSSLCDWNDNSAIDILWDTSAAYEYDVDATFSCANGFCN
jgi:hypothetical protein